MKQKRSLSSFTRNDDGATIVEFAIVAMVFFFMLFAIIEYGMFMMTKVAVESIVSQAGRKASISSDIPGCTRICQVRNFITPKIQALVNVDTVAFTTRNLSTGTGSTFAGDLCLATVPHVGGVCPPGVPWEDLGGNPPAFGFDSGATPTDVGNPGDMIEIQVAVPWKVMNPMFKAIGLFGPNDMTVIQSNTVIKNEN